MKLIKKRQVRNKYIYVAFASLVLMCLSYYGYHRFKIGYGIAIESRHYFKKAKAFLNWVQKPSPCKGQLFLCPLSNFI